MHKIKNLNTSENKRIRLIPLTEAIGNITGSLGAIAKDGEDIIICLSPEEPSVEEFYEHQYYADGHAVMLRSQSNFRVDRVDANGVQEEALGGLLTASRGLAVSPDNLFIVDYTDNTETEQAFVLKRKDTAGIAHFEIPVVVDHNGEAPVGAGTVAWSADSQLLAVNSWDSSPNNYFIYKRQPDNTFVQVFKMKRETSVRIAFTPDSAQLVLAEMNYGGELFHVVPYVFDVNANGELDTNAYALVGEFLPTENHFKSSQITSDILWLSDKVAVMSRTFGLNAITIDPVAKTVTGKNLVSPAYEFEESLRTLLLLDGNTKLGFVTWDGDEDMLGVVNFNAAELTVDLSSLNLSDIDPLTGDEGNMRVHPLNDMLISINSNTQPSTLDWHLVNADNTATKIVPVTEEPAEFDSTISIVPLSQTNALKLYYAKGFETPTPDRHIYHDSPLADWPSVVSFSPNGATAQQITPSDTFVELFTETHWPNTLGYIADDLREFKRTENYQLIFSPDIVEAVRAIALAEPTRVVLTEDWIDLNVGGDYNYTTPVTAEELIDYIDNTAYLFYHSDLANPVELTYTLDLGRPSPLVYKLKPTMIITNRWVPDQLSVSADVTLAGLFAGVDGYGFIEFEFPNLTGEDSGGGSAYRNVKADGTGELVTLEARALVESYVNTSGDGHLTIKANELLYIQYNLLTETDVDLSANAAGIANLNCHYMKTAIPEHKFFYHRFFFAVQGF